MSNTKDKNYWVVQLDDGLSLVPSEWMAEEEKACFYPNYKMQRDIDNAVQNREIPNFGLDDNEWALYKVLNVFGSADTYAKGMDKLKMAKYISDVEDTDAANETMKKSRHDRSKRSYDESSSDELSPKKLKILPPLPPAGDAFMHLKKQISRKSSKSVQPIVSTNAIKLSVETPEPKRSLTIQHSAGTSFSMMNKKSSDSNGGVYRTIEHSSGTSFSMMNKKSSDSHGGVPTNRGNKENICDVDYKKEVLRKLNRILAEIGGVKERLAALEDQQGNQIHNNENRSLDPYGFPLDNEIDLTNLDLQLEDAGFFTQLVHCLGKIGGKDPDDMARNILTTIMTDSLAQLYSWAGKKKKKAFDDFNLVRVVQETVRTHYKNATDQTINHSISNWLVQAKLRQQRIEEKQAKNNNGT